MKVTAAYSKALATNLSEKWEKPLKKLREDDLLAKS
jgi:hypothetical protein